MDRRLPHPTHMSMSGALLIGDDCTTRPMISWSPAILEISCCSTGCSRQWRSLIMYIFPQMIIRTIPLLKVSFPIVVTMIRSRDHSRATERLTTKEEANTLENRNYDLTDMSRTLIWLTAHAMYNELFERWCRFSLDATAPEGSISPTCHE